MENDVVNAECGCAGACAVDSNGNGICDEDEIMGCTIQIACNYNCNFR